MMPARRRTRARRIPATNSYLSGVTVDATRSSWRPEVAGVDRSVIIPTMRRRSWVLAGLVLSLVAGGNGELLGQTHLHWDYGGVSTRAGNVWIGVRRNGRITTSVQVGDLSILGSNDGYTGVSFPTAAGTFYSYSNIRGGSSNGYYVPSTSRWNPLVMSNRAPAPYAWPPAQWKPWRP
jgi:hypothetical protein